MTALATIDQKVVLFMGDELIAVRADDKEVYVSLSNLCDALGINRKSQRDRIVRNEVLSDGYVLMSVVIHDTPQNIGMLRANLVPLWLAGMSTSRLTGEAKEKVVVYQTKAAQVLWEAFQDGRLSTDISFDEIIQDMESDAVQAYKIAMAIARLARNQIMLETETRERLDEHETRLEQLETKFNDPNRTISEEQASQLSQAVKLVAMKLSENTGRNEYGGVYGELYRRFNVTSYKLLPLDKFQTAMDWLNEWHQSIADTDIPF